MPTATIHTATLHGTEAVPLTVTVEILDRLPCVTIAGIPSSAVRETAERVRSAISEAGYDMPRKRVVVTVEPDVHRVGSGLDLPIAVGVLVASGQLAPSVVKDRCYVGELSLDGFVHPVRGAVAMQMAAVMAGLSLVYPVGWCLSTAATMPAADLVGLLKSCHQPLTPRDLPPHLTEPWQAVSDAVVGGCRSVLLRGPAGCGKTMLAQRVPWALDVRLGPPVGAELTELAAVRDAAGLLDMQATEVAVRRPFRAPHHTVSTAGMVGNGRLLPGEATLAHGGVLFLDDAPEFARATTELLRSAFEGGEVTLTRMGGTTTLPAFFVLVMACSTCPCGRRGSRRRCDCGEDMLRRWDERVQHLTDTFGATVVDVPAAPARS